MKVEFYRHHLTEEDIASVSKVLRSTFLTTGPVTAQFERAFADYTGLPFVVGLNSCTAAIHLSLLALDIGPGDEVITTPMTFIASATAIMQAGAVPIFVDVEAETGLMDVSKIEAAITPQTRAVLPVHLYGTMVDMRALKEVADRYGLKIIEDCAHCIEGKRDDVRPGQLSDAACYSFYATKNLTCGEGGAVATRHENLAEKLKRMSLHGMSKDAAGRYSDKYQHWDMVTFGWKYNMHDISAALLIKQIDRIHSHWKRRDQIWRAYDNGLAQLPNISTPQTKGQSACHLYTIWVDPRQRDTILHGMQDKGIGVAVNYRAIHTLTFFREHLGFAPDDFPEANRIGRQTITLPLYPRLTDEEVNYVITSLTALVKSVGIP